MCRSLRFGTVLLCLGVFQITLIPAARAAANAGADGIPGQYLRGEAAIEALADRLPQVAAEHQMDAGVLEKILREDHTARIDRNGRLLFFEPDLPSLQREGVLAQDSTPTSAESAIPLDQTFQLHSRPGASKLIYLDFDGHVIRGSAWNANNNGADIVAPAWDIDGNVASFGSNELAMIQRMWQRVAEDYAPFDVDVTTEYPGEAALTRSTSSDTQYGMRVLVSPISQYFGAYGGIAYVGVFGMVGDTYKPALVFPENLANNEKYIGEACAHEAGHTLGLSHDGTTTGQSYYVGQGSGETGWAPVMGVGYYKNLSQWSKGEYASANNTEDDLTKIASFVGYIPDDYGNSASTAAVFPAGAAPKASGVIGAANDRDLFKFTTGAGAIRFDIYPAALGPNLDISASLVDSSGTVIANNNGVDVLGASLSLTVNAGTYYLSVAATGKGDPLVTGYSAYGSMGGYDVVGSIVSASGNIPPTAMASLSASSGPAPLNVTFDASGSTDPDGSIVSYQWDFGDGTSASGPQTSHIYSNPGTYLATLTVTDNSGATASTSRSIVAESASTLTSCRVASLQLTVNASRSGDSVTATIQVVDAQGLALSGATVAGTWSGALTGISTGVTGANGTVILTSKRTKRIGGVAFTVNSVQKTGYTFTSDSSSSSQITLY